MSNTETIVIQLNKDEEELIKDYAKRHGLTVEQLIMNTILEKIEDEEDLVIYEKAMDEYNKNPETYSLEETKKIIRFEIN